MRARHNRWLAVVTTKDDLSSPQRPVPAVARPQVRSSRGHAATTNNLDHAEYDGTDKREGDIGGDHAQPVDESHGNAPLVYVTGAINARVRPDVPAENTAWLHHARNRTRWNRKTWLNIRKIKALMSL
jgi:hypothetical protein